MTAPALSLNRALFALWCLFWLLMVVVAYQEEMPGEHLRWWEPLLWEGSSALVATGWLLLQRRAARRWNQYLDQPLRWFGRHLRYLPLVALVFVAAIYALRHAVYAAVGETYEHESWLWLLVYESIKLLLFTALWLGIIFGLESFMRWREERERLLSLQKALAQAQLAQLRAQLQPHFLFNALNTISALMHSDVERADRLLTRLADLLRASLALGDRPMTTLREELALARAYADIMHERFEHRVRLSWDIGEECLDATIPTMLLQPLLENAFKHGVERSREPVHIAVSAARAGEELQLRIRNDGQLADPAAGDTARAGIGLLNSRERLALLYGDGARLELMQDGQSVVASLVLPWQVSRP